MWDAMLKHLLMLALLLGMSGCGCEPDARPGGGGSPVVPQNAGLVVKARLAPIPVAPPAIGPERFRVDERMLAGP